MQDERAACAVGDRHGDSGVQARLALEDAAHGRVERAHLDELAARLARKGSRVVDGAVHERGGVARLPHVLVGELEPLGVGRIEDELCVGERLLRVRYEAQHVGVAEVLEHARDDDERRKGGVHVLPHRHGRQAGVHHSEPADAGNIRTRPSATSSKSASISS